MSIRDSIDREQLYRAIGRTASRARRRLGFTQEDAAELIGVSTEFYSRLDRGIGAASVPTLRKLARYLHCSLDDLLGLAPPDGEPARPLPPMAPETVAMCETPPAVRRLLRNLAEYPPNVVEGTLRFVEEMQEIMAQPSPPGAKRSARGRSRRARAGDESG